MGLFDFNRKRLEGQYKPSKSISVRGKSTVGRKVTAYGDGSSYGGGGAGAGGTSGASGNFSISRYNGTHQTLEAGSIIQEWMPTDPVSLHALWRQIYAHDSISGPAVDLIANLPWSDWDLMGIKDEGQKKIFENAMTNLGAETLMVPLTVEYLVIGRISGNLLFSEDAGTWTGFLP